MLSYVGNDILARTLVERQCSGDGGEVSERLGNATQDVLGHTHAPVSLFQGLPYQVKVCQDDGVVAFRSFCSVRSNLCCLPGARGYYELTILVTDAEPEFGFASTAFKRVPGAMGKGMGDDNMSWAFDGARKCAWHCGKNVPYTCVWKVGDVLGLACDLAEIHMHVSVDSCFTAPNGLVLHLNADSVQQGFFAAFSGSSGKCSAILAPRPSITRSHCRISNRLSTFTILHNLSPSLPPLHSNMSIPTYYTLHPPPLLRMCWCLVATHGLEHLINKSLSPYPTMSKCSPYSETA